MRVTPGVSFALALLTATATSSLVAQSAPRQDRPPRAPITDPRGFGGVALQVAAPQGEFKNTTDNAIGYGLGAHFLGGLDPSSVLNWRLDASFLTYGNVTQRVPLSPTLGNLIRVDLRTTNNILNVVTGPQLLAPRGPIMPYVNALGGFSVFWTESTVEGSNNVQPFANTTNTADISWSYGASVGTYVRVWQGDRPVSLDLGARYLRQDDAKYLTRQQIRDATGVDALQRLQPSRTRADFVTYYLGVTIALY
ncbi:MAG: hypothetical protein MUE41_09875 [Gemmatimonadaceae bacterium]|jgi:hypothetical protein|nr:hypothetical protein [Gemmatimonadaceae bacterium]